MFELVWPAPTRAADVGWPHPARTVNDATVTHSSEHLRITAPNRCPVRYTCRTQGERNRPRGVQARRDPQAVLQI